MSNLKRRQEVLRRINEVHGELGFVGQALDDPELKDKDLLLDEYKQAVEEMFKLLRELRRLIKP